MRKVLLTVGLWLLLVLGQHGAVLHQLSHLVRASGAQVTVHVADEADKTCELCLAYSQLTSPVSHAVPDFTLERATATLGPQRAVAATPVDLPTPRSRGPPAPRLNS